MTQANLKNNPSSSLLKDARLGKGLTLEIVHESTKIPMDALRAIEDGYSTRILTPFYYRGFIKIYAEFLGLNVSEVLKEYNVQASLAVKPVINNKKSAPAPAKSKPQGPPAAEMFGDFWQSFWTAKTRKNLLRIVGILVAVFILVKIGGCIAGAMKANSKKAKTTVVKTINKKQTAPPKIEQKVSVAEEPDEIKIPANRKVSLVVHAPRDTWVQVRADGKTVFQMTMKKGTMENWEAEREIELSGKNIGNLDLEVNGKDVSPVGSFNRKAKAIIITKDGLNVKK